jgi:uncharacterized protein (DUF1330 family)
VSDASPEVERLNEEGLADFSERREEEAPVVMLNLLAFKPDGGRERYQQYGEAVAPLFAGVGGRVLYAGRPAPAMIGAESWDLVILAEYPSRGAFLEMIGSPAYREIAHLRTEALRRGELHPIDPLDGELPGVSESGLSG